MKKIKRAQAFKQLLNLLQFYSPEALRQFFGDALKFKLPPHLRNLQIDEIVIRGKDYTNNENVADYLRGFNRIECNHSDEYKELLSLFMNYIVGWRGINKLSALVINRRIMRFRQSAKRVLAKHRDERAGDEGFDPSERPFRGLMIFTYGIKKLYHKTM